MATDPSSSPSRFREGVLMDLLGDMSGLSGRDTHTSHGTGTVAGGSGTGSGTSNTARGADMSGLTTLGGAHDAMSALQDELTSLRSSMSNLRAENDELARKLSVSESVLESRTAELMLLHAVTGAVRQREDETVRDPASQARAFQEYLDNSPHLSMLQRRVAELDAANTQLRNDVLDAEHRYEFVSTARELLKTEVADLQSKLIVATAKGPDHMAEFEYVQAQLQRLRDESSESAAKAQQKIRQLTSELDAARAELETLRGTDRVAVAEAERNDAVFERELAAEGKHLLHRQLEIANEDRAALREDLQYARSSIAQLKEAASQAESEHRREREERSQEMEKVSADLAELERYRREWRSMQEGLRVEREALKGEVAELNALLASHLAGRDTESTATQRLIQEVERSKERVASVSSDLEQSRAENNRLRVELLELRETMAQRVREAEADKERVMRRTVEIAQSADEAVAEGRETSNQLESVRRQLLETAHERDTLATALRESQEAVRGLERANEELKAERRRDHSEFSSYAAKMREHRDALTRAKAHNAELVDQVVTLRSEVDTLSHKLADVETTHAEELRLITERLQEELRHEAESRRRETSVLSARLARADEDHERVLAREEAEQRRLEALLDRAREEAVLAGNKLPSIAQERDHLARELERVARLVPQLEERVRSLAVELEQARNDRNTRVTELSARIQSLETRAEAARNLESRNDDLHREAERLRGDNQRLVAEVRRWKDKRISQLVATPWGPEDGGAAGAIKTREEDGWAGRDAFAAQRAYGAQMQNVNNGMPRR